MGDLLKEFLARPHAVQILGEVVRHIKNKVTPSVFAASYLELLRSTDDSVRQAATGVLTFSAARSWSEVREYLLGKVNEDDRDVLHLPEAEVFYNKWRKIVLQQFGEAYENMSGNPDGVPQPE